MGVELSTIMNSSQTSLVKYSNLSPSNLMKLKKFFEKNSTSVIDRKGLMEILNTLKFETDIIFDFFDIDGNGVIDAYEYICSVAMITHSSNEIKAEFLFRLFDTNKNNYLSKYELSLLVTNFFLTKRDYTTLDKVEEYTNQIFNKADLDLDDRLSLREFISYIRKDQDLLSLFTCYSCLSGNKDDEESQLKVNGDSIKEDVKPSEHDADIESEINKGKEERIQIIQKIKEGAENLTIQEENSRFKEEKVTGSEFSSVKPWKGVVLSSVPTKYEPNSFEGQQPDSKLELEFIHGYRCHDTRNNLGYNAKGDIIYHTAAVGINFNKNSRKQSFYFHHLDDITSLAFHPNKKLVATGETGPNPLITIWDNETMECLSRFSSPLIKGINCLTFSNDGNLLCASAADDNHSIAVFDWEKGIQKYDDKSKPIKINHVKGLKATGNGTKSVIMSLTFNKKDDIIVATGIKEINFISFNNGEIKLNKASGMKSDQLQTFLCSIFQNDDILVVGTFIGDLYLFNSRSFSKSLKAHKGSVNSIISKESGFITGGNDGIVLIWDSNFCITKSLSINNLKINSICPKIRSISESSEGYILIGTRGGEIIELSDDSCNILIRGHFDEELWGLCVHPVDNKFYTAGQDKLLAEWSIDKKEIIKFTKLNNPIERIAISAYDGDLALGTTSGEVLIYDSNSFSLKMTKRDRKDCISVLKYTPNGRFLGVGAADNLIIIYEASAKYNLKLKLTGHVSRITHLDFDVDSDIIQSTSSYDILFHSISGGKVISKGASTFRDTEWSSWSLIFGWPVQGIWPPCSSGDDINSVDRDKEKKVIASGDDYGKVKLFKYPCPVEKASFYPYIGHSYHVTSVRFSASNDNLISIGGNDKAIFQWKYVRDNSEIIQNFDDTYDDEEYNLTKNENIHRAQVNPSKWSLEIKASTPKNYIPPKDAGECPNESLKLKYIHGYRGFDSKNNVKFTSSGDVLFHSAAVDIVLNIKENTQSFFNHHRDDIVSQAIHPNGKIAASGQIAKSDKAKDVDLFVFDIQSKAIIASLKGFHLNAIRILCFSPNGSKLLTCGQDENNSIAIYDWKNSKLLGSSPGDKIRLTEALFQSEKDFVTIGKKCIKFWKHNGRSITSQKGLFGKIPCNSQLSLVFAFEDKRCITGDDKGNLIVWTANHAKDFNNISDSPVSVLIYKAGNLFSGCQNGVIRILDESLKQIFQIKTSKFTNFTPGIRALDCDDQKNILIGTRGCEIILYNLEQKTSRFLVRSAYEGEIWALTVCPVNAFLFATGGDDHTLRIYNSKRNMMISHLTIEHDFRAIDWSSDGDFIVIGTMFGWIFYIEVPKMTVESKYVSIFKKKEEWIQEIKISPNNKFVAYSAHGSSFKIEILNINPDKTFSLYAVVNARVTSAITHLDWSINSDFLVVNTLSLEIKFISVSEKKIIAACSANSIEWNTWTCIFGFQVQGIWNPNEVGYSANYTCLSDNKKILASGDDMGYVKLFKAPSTMINSKSKVYKGHSSQIPKVRFSRNDLFLYSVGGNDKSVFVWETDFSLGNNYNPSKEIFHYDTEIIRTDFSKEEQDKPSEIEPIIKLNPSKDDNTSQINKNNNNNQSFIKENAVENEEHANYLKSEEALIGDEKLSMEQWRSNVFKANWNLPEDFKHELSVKLTPEYVIGYRSKDSRNNLKYLDDNTIIYPAGSIIIVSDIKKNTQRHLIKNKEEIQAFSIHAEKKLIAVGDILKNKSSNTTYLTIWNYESFEEVLCIEKVSIKGLVSVSFNTTGDYLVCIGNDDEHTISIVDVLIEKKIISSSNGSKNKILDCCYRTENEFGAVGVLYFSIWTVKGKELSESKVNIKSSDKFGVITIFEGKYITGGSTGEITIWDLMNIKNSNLTHNKAVDSLCVRGENIISAGRDGFICILDRNLEKLRSLDLSKIGLDSSMSIVISIDVSNDKSKLLIGTISSEIYEICFSDRSFTTQGNHEINKILMTHCTVSMNSIFPNELSAILYLKNNNVFITVGEDWTLRIWDNNTNKLNKVVRLDNENGKLKGHGKCLAVDDKETVICVGFKELCIFSYPDFDEIKRIEIKEGVNEVKYSKCGNFLAIGSNDKVIFIVDANKNQKIQSLRGHQGPVLKLNWDMNSKYLMSNSLSGEMFIWETTSWKQLPKGPEILKEELWYEWTCLFGWCVQGLWQTGYNVGDVICISRSNKENEKDKTRLIAFSDMKGLQLAKFPLILTTQSKITLNGHASKINSICFDRDDKYMISIGAFDGCIIKWKLI